MSRDHPNQGIIPSPSGPRSNARELERHQRQRHEQPEQGLDLTVPPGTGERETSIAADGALSVAFIVARELRPERRFLKARRHAERDDQLGRDKHGHQWRP